MVGVDMKKFLALMAVVMVVGLTGCSSEGDEYFRAWAHMAAICHDGNWSPTFEKAWSDYKFGIISYKEYLAITNK
jgi:hypothetical protein